MKSLFIVVLSILALILLIVIIRSGSRLNEKDSQISINSGNLNQTNMEMEITSEAFENGAAIPAKYTCDGQNIIPPLQIDGISGKTVSLALIMEDPDIPDFVKQNRGIEVFDHWVVFNIKIHDSRFMIQEGEEPEGVFGTNSSGENKYTGPCPPDREHRYFFKAFALGSDLDLPAGSSKADVEKAMEGHIISEAVLMGRYERVE